MEQTPSELEKKYYKGNVGKSLTACAAFFYKYSNGYFICLDDNDAMIMKSGSTQQVKLFFKAVLDPDAVTQPIKVPTTVLKAGSKSLEALNAEEEAGPVKRKTRVAAKKKKESTGTVISFDKELLQEGILRMFVNDRIAIEEEIPLNEALDFYYHLKEVDQPRLKERTRREKMLGLDYRQLLEARRQYNEDDEEDSDVDDEDESLEVEDINSFDYGTDEGDPNEMPATFIFDSSVCFISNLTRAEIDPAVWDRFTTVCIELTPVEFMNKLEEVLPNLGRIDNTVSKVPQEQVDWAKKVIFIILKAIVEAWALHQPLMGVDIDIKKRSLTFRLVMELVNDLLRLGRNEIIKQGLKGTLQSAAIRGQVIGKCERMVMSKAIRKIVFGE